jgi:putative membrane protein insertion efficiency factor
MLIALIKAYKYTLSPFIGASCRYYPTCSSYAEQAIKLHGAFQGGWLAIKRIFSCHPWGSWGYDPVPPKNNKTEKKLS